MGLHEITHEATRARLVERLQRARNRLLDLEMRAADLLDQAREKREEVAELEAELAASPEPTP